MAGTERRITGGNKKERLIALVQGLNPTVL